MVTSAGRQGHVQPCRGVTTDGGIRQVLLTLHPAHTLRNQLSRWVRGSYFLIGAPQHCPPDRLVDERLQISRVSGGNNAGVLHTVRTDLAQHQVQEPVGGTVDLDQHHGPTTHLGQHLSQRQPTRGLGLTEPEEPPPATKVVVVVTLRLLQDRKSTRLNSSHVAISYAVFCLK